LRHAPSLFIFVRGKDVAAGQLSAEKSLHAWFGAEAVEYAPSNVNLKMNCRPQCGACCIAPSISSPIPGMPNGKPAGVPCVQLMDDLRCAIFGKPERPACCSGLQASAEMCGESREAGMFYLTRLEQLTAP